MEGEVVNTSTSTGMVHNSTVYRNDTQNGTEYPSTVLDHITLIVLCIGVITNTLVITVVSKTKLGSMYIYIYYYYLKNVEKHQQVHKNVIKQINLEFH